MIRPLGTIKASGDRSGVVLALGTAAVALILVAAVAYPLRALGVAGGETSDGRYGLRVAPNVVVAGTTQKSFLPFWVYWNFSGYESKTAREGIGGYDEYYRVVTTMAAVAAERGCGRVMWEYGLKRLDSYGSPMSLMLLPHWTDGCLASMEGSLLRVDAERAVPLHQPGRTLGRTVTAGTGGAVRGHEPRLRSRTHAALRRALLHGVLGFPDH